MKVKLNVFPDVSVCGEPWERTSFRLASWSFLLRGWLETSGVWPGPRLGGNRDAGNAVGTVFSAFLDTSAVTYMTTTLLNIDSWFLFFPMTHDFKFSFEVYTFANVYSKLSSDVSFWHVWRSSTFQLAQRRFLPLLGNIQERKGKVLYRNRFLPYVHSRHIYPYEFHCSEIFSVRSDKVMGEPWSTQWCVIYMCVSVQSIKTINFEKTKPSKNSEG